jgi:hypothetical protein
MVMTQDNPQFGEFIERLGGPEGCNFREEKPKGMTWDCKGGKDKTLATGLLRRMGLSEDEIRSSFAYFEARGGFCDCEIVLNVGDTTGGAA